MWQHGLSRLECSSDLASWERLSKQAMMLTYCAREASDEVEKEAIQALTADWLAGSTSIASQLDQAFGSQDPNFTTFHLKSFSEKVVTLKAAAVQAAVAGLSSTQDQALIKHWMMVLVNTIECIFCMIF